MRFLRTHNGEIVKGAGGFNVRKGTAARSFQTMNVVWAERFRTGKACGYRFMDTCRGGASASQCHQMAVSLTGGAQWRRICRVPAMGSQRRGAAKAAACNGAAAYRGIGIRKSARTHLGDFASTENRSGQGNQERKERGGKRGERNVCIIKNNKRVKNIEYRLTG